MAPAPSPERPDRLVGRPSIRIRTALLVAVLALALGLAACSDKDSDGGSSSDTTATTAPGTTADGGSTTSTTEGPATTSTSTAPSTTAAVTSTTAATGTTAPGGATTPGLGTLSEGTHLGYLTGSTEGEVEGQAVEIVSFDPVDLLTGQAAQDAAAAHGDEVDNDYYLVNDDKSLIQLPVIPDSQVSILQDGTPTLVAGSVQEAVNQPDLYEIEVVVVRGVSLITSIKGYFLP